jgi:hypothetical protein
MQNDGDFVDVILLYMGVTLCLTDMTFSGDGVRMLLDKRHGLFTFTV